MAPTWLYTRLRLKYEPGASGEVKRERVRVAKLALANVVEEVNINAQRHPSLLFANFMGAKKIGRQSVPRESLQPLKPEERPYVVVIGSGLSGLSCAYELLQSQRFNVVVLEAQERVGGRTWTVNQDNFQEAIIDTTHKFPTVERGGELIGLNHFFWLAYAIKFGLHLDYLDDVTEETEPTAEEEETYIYMKLIIDEFDRKAATIPLFSEDGTEKPLKPWQLTCARELDEQSLEHYCKGLLDEYEGYTTEEVTEKKGFTLTRFDFGKFQAAMKATMDDFENNNGLPCNQQSLYFNLVIIANGNRTIEKKLFDSFKDSTDGGRLAKQDRVLTFWDHSELFRCREGNQALSLKFKEHILKLGGKIYTNHTVEAINLEGPNAKITLAGGVKFKLGEKAKIEKVVAAVPPVAWKHIHFTPTLPHHSTPQTGFLVKYLFNVHPQTTRIFRTLPAADHSTWAMLWEARKNNAEEGTDEKVNTIALFAGGSHAQLLSQPPNVNKLPVEVARRQYIIDNMNKMSGGADQVFHEKDILGDVFMDFPNNHLFGGYSCPGVGEVMRLGEFVHTPFQNKLFFAGEYACRYKWNGFMEGALISGAGTAKEVLKVDANARN